MLLILLLCLFHTSAGFLVPNPPGKYNVTLTTGSLTDYTRSMMIDAKPVPRKLMLSVFQPAKCATSVAVPYMPNKTAQYQGSFLQTVFNVTMDLSPLFLEAQLPVCPNHENGCSNPDHWPILLFSPGYSIPRLYYSTIASAIASNGFMVITYDHPEDANIITYPDGSAVYNNAPFDFSDATLASYEKINVVDAFFLVDQLNNRTAMAKLLPSCRTRPLRTDRIGIIGHSLGGASAIIAASQDSRLRGAINWDGTIFGSLPPKGISKPVLFMSAGIDAPSWVERWPKLHGPKLWVKIANTSHYTFSDMPTLLQAAGQNATAIAGDLLGTIMPSTMVDILAAYTTAWMNGVFAGKIGGSLLQGKESEKYPEVSVVRKANY